MFSGMMDAIGAAQADVNAINGQMATDATENPDALLGDSLKMMQATQKMSTLVEAFTKSMKALHDAQKSAIQNAH